MLKFTAKPLNAYTTVHQVSLFSLLKPFIIIVNFSINRRTPLEPKALFRFDASDANLEQLEPPDFSIQNLIRWRLEISKDETYQDYLKNLNHKQTKNFQKTVNKFKNSGASLSVIEKDWSHYVDAVYTLYANVASRHPPGIYDREYFRQIAKKPEYKLICAFLKDQMIGAILILEESDIIHSVCCGLDYHHSKECYAYSSMHYAFIRHAIEAKKFTKADVGFTGDEAKQILNFKPIPSRLDVYTSNRIFRVLLHWFSKYFTATVTAQSKLKINIR